MPSTMETYRVQKLEEKSSKKSATGRKKVFSMLLEHTRCYISPLRKISPTVELKRPISCNRRYAEVGARRCYYGDAFLEPYMQGLSNDVIHNSVDEVFDGSSNVFKKRIQEDYPSNDDRASSLSSPVSNSLDTPLDEKTESHFRLVEAHAGSRGSLNQLISGDECSEGSSENSSLVGDEETSCDITLLERLVRSHPIWFLPDIQRAGAFHLLQGKEDGNFIVRQSSHNSTMAISVRLPIGKGPYIEHYLIQGSEDGQLGLESSDNKFSSIPLLIAHYCQCCDELPVQLTLPRAIREAKNRQQLTSFALLGQEFWRYPMANRRQSLKTEVESPLPPSTVTIKDSLSRSSQNASFPSCSSSSSNSPASSLSSFESSSNNNNNNSALEPSSLGFDTDSNVLAEKSPLQSNSLMTTLKDSASFSSVVPYNQIGIPVSSSESSSSLPFETSHAQPILSTRRPRPKPPNTLNLCSTTALPIPKNAENPPENNGFQMQFATAASKTPPLPPPRWTKPSLSGSTISNAQNFTVTTTDSSPSPPDVKMASVQLSTLVNTKLGKPTIPSQVMRTTTLTTSLPTIAPTPLPRSHIPQIISPSPSQCSQVLSPVSEGNTRPFSKRSKRSKESHHYRESDIIETYHRSTAADKASDYEDIWDVVERTAVTMLVTPTEPLARSTTNVNRFGMMLDIPTEKSGSVNNVAVPQTPIAKERKSPIPEVNESVAVDPKLGSPFYAEPADTIKLEALNKRTKSSEFVPQQTNSHRHSVPVGFHQWLPVISGTSVLGRIDSKEELLINSSYSSSLDNLVILRNSRRNSSSNFNQATKNAKPVEPPKINRETNGGTSTTWAVDSSWKFIETNEETNEDDKHSVIDRDNYVDHKLLSEESQKEESVKLAEHGSTFREMIFQRLPESRLSPVFDGTKFDNKQEENYVNHQVLIEPTNNCNVTNDSNNNFDNGFSGMSQISDNSDDAQTIFSEPWDSTQWEHLLTPTKQVSGECDSNQINKCKSFKERLDPLLSPARLKALSTTRSEDSAPGATIRAYAFKLASDNETVFSKTIDNFIACTKESREIKPQVVMRNMRQFMSGMKNYLVTHGEREFIKEVESERSKLKSTEFLNLDTILEDVMHKLVITPLKDHLNTLFVKEYEQNGALVALIDNIKYARTKPPRDLGIRDKLILPTVADLREIVNLFDELQFADSPLEKLKLLLAAIAVIFHSVKSVRCEQGAIFLGADDFLPIFVWVLVQVGMVAAEVEAEYMWGLLHPSLLSGEGGYYLTTLSSAVNVLKNFHQCSNSIPAVSWCSDPLTEFKCVLKVVVPNERNGSLLTKTLPVRPNMTTKDICKIIALKLRITNPQDYGLFKLVGGEESILNDMECPQDVKSELTAEGKHCLFAYKRIDAKIAWPHSTNPSQEKR